MQYSTAKQKLDDMFADKVVKLRKSRLGGISEKTWQMLLDVAFWEYGLEQMQYLVRSESDNINQQVIIYYRDKVISDKIILY